MGGCVEDNKREHQDANKRSELSRRRLLGSGLLVGGNMVWMTPVIQSLGSVASAQGSPRPQRGPKPQPPGWENRPGGSNVPPGLGGR